MPAVQDLSKLEERLHVIRAQWGDSTAFTKLVERYTARLTYFVRRLLSGDAAGADDVVQETWLIVYRRLPSLKNHDSFVGWLYGIARHAALRYSGRKPQEISHEAIETESGPDDGPFSTEDAEWVHAGLDQLTVEHREVLTLRFLEEMSYEEIASVVECSVGTVRSRLHYAKRALRKILRSASHGPRQNVG